MTKFLFTLGIYQNYKQLRLPFEIDLEINNVQINNISLKKSVSIFQTQYVVQTRKREGR